MATLIKTNGSKVKVQPQYEHYELKELQKFVGGYIEVTPAKDGGILVINEEGKLLGLPYNSAATALHKYPDDMIVGDVLYIPKSELSTMD